MSVSVDIMLDMYRMMVRIRTFESSLMDLFKRKIIRNAYHPYAGQEASAVGVCMSLRKDDLILGTHRSQGHNLAKGADPKYMLAEILGNETGYCKGLGGSMHITILEIGCLGAFPVVGANLPISVGAALGLKFQGSDNVVVAFTGDGATNTGNFHESLNLASIWKLPVIFVVENNQYAISTRVDQALNISDLSTRANSYNIPSIRVNGFDVLVVHSATSEAVTRARRGDGPTLLVTECYRFGGHSSSDPEVYRSREEVSEQREKDPILYFQKYLLENELGTQEQLSNIRQEEEQLAIEAIQFACQSPQPDLTNFKDYIFA